MSQVSLADARRVIAAAEKKAAEIGQPMNIAVADEGGNIVAHVRMDGAWIGSIDISQKKAYTSRAFDISTKDLATHSQSGGQFFGIHASNNGKIMIFAGGIPLKKGGKVVGAVGVSGGSGEQDQTVDDLQERRPQRPLPTEARDVAVERDVLAGDGLTRGPPRRDHRAPTQRGQHEMQQARPVDAVRQNRPRACGDRRPLGATGGEHEPRRPPARVVAIDGCPGYAGSRIDCAPDAGWARQCVLRNRLVQAEP